MVCKSQGEPASLADLFQEKVFVSLVSYADESGMHDPTGLHHGSDVATVCGYVSHKESWDAFSDEWQTALDKRGVEVFHMAEFMDKINGPSKPDWPYRGWSEPDRDSFMRTLIPIARRYVILGVGGVLNVHDYDIVSPAWLKTDTGHPYHFCFQLFFDCLLPMLEQFEPALAPGEQVAFFFDQNKQFEERASEAFHLIKALRDTNDRFGTITFAEKRRCKGLQAADLLAYLMRSAQSRKIRTGSVAIPSGNWEEDLVSDRNVKMCYYDAGNLPVAIAGLLRLRLEIFEALTKQQESRGGSDMATAREFQCSRVAQILNDAHRNYDVIFDDRQDDYIRFTVKHAGTIILNPTSGHLTVNELATKSDDAIRQLLISLSHGLITF